MISVLHWHKDRHVRQSLDAAQLRTLRDELRQPRCVLWIDLENPTAEEETLVFEEFFPVHPLTLEDATRLHRKPDAPPHFPKVEEFADYLFVVANPLTQAFVDTLQADGKAAPANHGVTQLSAVITQNFLITHHYEPVASVGEAKTFLDRHEGQLDRGPDYVFHLILDDMVDEYALVLDHFDDSLEEVEARVFAQPDRAILQALLGLKRRISTLRKTLVSEREVLARLARGDFALIEEGERAYYRNVYDHLVRFTERIESSRDMASDLLQIHLSVISNKLNEIMKVLAMMSTLILPMTLIAGIYGMNFKHQPEYDWPLGYAFALALMLLTGVGAVAFFKWRNWF